MALFMTLLKESRLGSAVMSCNNLGGFPASNGLCYLVTIFIEASHLVIFALQAQIAHYPIRPPS